MNTTSDDMPEPVLVDGLKQASPMIDPFGRAVTYLRVSVTDRCDFRCVYCMSENMTFLPKKDLLTLEELDRMCSAFVGLGVRKLRITGGEPLVRRNIMQFTERRWVQSQVNLKQTSDGVPVASEVGWITYTERASDELCAPAMELAARE